MPVYDQQDHTRNSRSSVPKQHLVQTDLRKYLKTPPPTPKSTDIPPLHPGAWQLVTSSENNEENWDHEHPKKRRKM